MYARTQIQSAMDRYLRQQRTSGPETGTGTGGHSGILGPKTPKEFFVDSVNGKDTNDGLDPRFPLATLAQALLNCTANNGDIIYLARKHAETVTAAVAISVAGVSIVGMGTNGTQKPTFTFNATAANWAVSAAEVYIEGVRFAASVTQAPTARLTCTGADMEVNDCEFFLGATDTIDDFVLGSGSQRAWIHDSEWRVTAAGCAEAIKISSATNSSGIRLEHLKFYTGSTANMPSVACIMSTIAFLDIFINDVQCSFGMIISFTSATCTGQINNAFGGQLGTSGNQIRIGGCYLSGGPVEGYLLRIADGNLPQTGNQLLGTSTGGRVNVLGLLGQVGTAVQAQACAVQFVAHPTVGSDTTLCATVDINAAATGQLLTFSPTGLAATAAILANPGGVAAAMFAFSKILGSGALLRFNTAASNTGTMKFDIWWRPYDPGSSLV